MSKERTLPFSQREGYRAVPGPLQLKELPETARMDLWNVLYAFFWHSNLDRRYLDGAWEVILRDVHAWHHHLPLDEWTGELYKVSNRLRTFIQQQPFDQVFDLFEYVMQHKHCPPHFIETVSNAFRVCQLAYAIDADPPVTIWPATTPEEGTELVRSVDELRSAGLDGSVTHLRNASKCINDGDWAGSVRESIHAVESIARLIDPAASEVLTPALKSLEEHRVLQHSALKQAFIKLYGYTCDEQGIRHALLDKAEANVTIDEAVFMLGACASFASYLWRKHQAAAAS